MNNIYNIDSKKIFKKLSLKYTTTSKGEFQLPCPNPLHHDSPGDGGSFFLNPKDLVFNCFGCDWQGSIFTFIKLYLNFTTTEDAINWLKDDNNFLFNQFEFLKGELGKRIDAQVSYETEIARNPFFLPKVRDINSKRILNFFSKRSISKDLALSYGAKVCLEGYYENRIIFPIFHEKKLYGFEARIIDKTLDNQKCLYPPNSSLKKIIYDIDYLKKDMPLYFTEGMMDCLSLKSRGYANSSCSFGSKITSHQVKILNTFKVIYLVPDNDDGGEEFISLFYEHVRMADVYVIKPPVGRDVDECDDSELKEILEYKQNISDYIVDKHLNLSTSFNNSDAYSSSRLNR